MSIKFLKSKGGVSNDVSNYISTENINTSENYYNIKAQIIKLPVLDLNNLDISLNGAISGCENLVSIDGIINSGKVTNIGSMFTSCGKLTSIPEFDTSSVTDMTTTFNGCASIKSIPVLNTKNVTKMVNTFLGCSSLIDVPILDTSKVTAVGYMFRNCTSLSTESLNNILAMMANSKVTTNKNLKYLGLTEEQATTCTTLSNWATCEAAGWTTGY